MRNAYTVALTVAGLIVGILIGYGLWGPGAAKLPEAQKELSSVQSQMERAKKEIAELKGNLGDIANQKLNLEKEIAELKETVEKMTRTKKGR